MQRLKFELTLMLHGWAIRLAILIFLGAGLLAIIQGVDRVEREAVHVDDLQVDFQQQLGHWQEQSKQQSFDFGSMGYYFFSPTYISTGPWAALVSGQRDSAMLKHRVRLLAISGQLYGSEIHNPNIQLLGGLDLAFVFVYLLPLIIGLLCARLLAEEVQSGRWPLLKAMASHRILQYRLALRFGFLTLINLLLLLTGAVIAHISLDASFFAVLLAILAYQLFWFAMCGFIIRWKFNSVNSYLSFVSAWLLFVVVIPGLSSLYLSSVYHTDSGMALSIQQRDAMHSAWDKDKQASLDEFLGIYPQFADTPKLPAAFHWKWYFAMQHMSDLAVADETAEYRRTISSRINAAEKLQWFSPAVLLQNLLERTADTDTRSQQDYLQAIERYHGELRDYYNIRLFYDKPIAADELSDYPRFNYLPENRSPPLLNSLFLCCLAGFLMWISVNKKLTL